MTVREISQKFGLPERAVRDLLSSGLFPGQKIEGVWQVESDDALSFADFLKRLRERRQRQQDSPRTPSGRRSFGQGQYQDNERNRYGWD